jgi:hypothetical protein
MLVKTMSLMVVLDFATSVLLLGLTGGAAGMPLIGLRSGAIVTPPETPDAVPDGTKGRMVVFPAGE